MTEPCPVLIAPPSPRTPSPQPVVEFPDDEVPPCTQHCFACFSMLHIEIFSMLHVETFSMFHVGECSFLFLINALFLLVIYFVFIFIYLYSY